MEIFRGHITEVDAKQRNTEARDKEILDKIKDHIVEDKEISDTLDSINFTAVQDILTRHLHKSVPGETRKANIIRRNRIILTNDAGLTALGGTTTAAMRGMQPENFLLVNVDNLRKEISMGLWAGSMQLSVLYRLVHEQVHAMSSYYQREAKSGRGEAQVGLVQWRWQRGAEPTKIYDLLNEGVTDKLARLVMRELGESFPVKGVTREALEKMSDVLGNPHLFGPMYLAAVHLVNAIEAKIAQYDASVSAEDVWHALIHATITGLNLDDRRAKKMLDTAVGKEGFTQKLASEEWPDVRLTVKEDKLLHDFANFTLATLTEDKRMRDLFAKTRQSQTKS